MLCAKRSVNGILELESSETDQTECLPGRIHRKEHAKVQFERDWSQSAVHPNPSDTICQVITMDRRLIKAEIKE